MSNCNPVFPILIPRTADGEGLVEKHYVFLKRLCQVLCALGSQLCALLVSLLNSSSNLSKDSFCVWERDKPGVTWDQCSLCTFGSPKVFSTLLEKTEITFLADGITGSC